VAVLGAVLLGDLGADLGGLLAVRLPRSAAFSAIIIFVPQVPHPHPGVDERRGGASRPIVRGITAPAGRKPDGDAREARRQSREAPVTAGPVSAAVDGQRRPVRRLEEPTLALGLLRTQPIGALGSSRLTPDGAPGLEGG
jgi:hypothetical protein